MIIHGVMQMYFFSFFFHLCGSEQKLHQFSVQSSYKKEYVLPRTNTKK